MLKSLRLIGIVRQRCTKHETYSTLYVSVYMLVLHVISIRNPLAILTPRVNKQLIAYFEDQLIYF